MRMTDSPLHPAVTAVTVRTGVIAVTPPRPMAAVAGLRHGCTHAHAARLMLLPAALLLTACGALNPFGASRTQAPAARSDAPAPHTARTSPTPPAPVVQRRGGGYYQDDGPGDTAPPNLDATPDAIPKDEPPLRSATNRSYVVFGKTYSPFTDNRAFSQRGTGSWYGRKFHGQKTSSGEPYDMYAMTAAHPTLPIPSYVRVTSLANGKSVVVRVNDRGPFHSDRIIDLSYTAALKLDYINQGSAAVEVTRVREAERLRESERVLVAAQTPAAAPSNPAAVVPPTTAPRPAPTNGVGDASAERRSQSGSPASAVANPVGAAAAAGAAAAPPIAAAAPVTPPAGPAVPAAAPAENPAPEPATIALPTATLPDGVYLQIGAFGARDNAESFRTRVSQQLAWLTETIFVVPGNNLHRLQVGPYKNRDEAGKIAERIRDTLQLKPVFVLR